MNDERRREAINILQYYLKLISNGSVTEMQMTHDRDSTGSRVTTLKLTVPGARVMAPDQD